MENFQEDAIKRVRQMQSANINPRPTENTPKPHVKPTDNEPKTEENIQNSFKSSNPLDTLFKDKEKLLILLLVMLLSQESSNTELILALLYIII